MYVLSVLSYGSELWIFSLKTSFSHTKSVRSKFRANWNRLNSVYNTCARRILGAPKGTSMDAVFVRLGWMPLYHLLIFRALVWFVKGKKGLAGPALQDLISDMNTNNRRWVRTRFCAPAMNTLSMLEPPSPGGSTDDYFSLTVPQLKNALRASILSHLNSQRIGVRVKSLI